MRLILACFTFGFMVQVVSIARNADDFIEEVEELNHKMQDAHPAGQYDIPHHQPAILPKNHFAPHHAPTPEARAEIMISNLNDVVRDLTGKIEKLEHQVGVLEQKLGDKHQDNVVTTSNVPPNDAVTYESDTLKSADDEQYATSKEATVKTLGTLSPEAVQALDPDVKKAKLEPVKPLEIPGTAKEHYDYAYNLLLSKDLGGAQIAFKAFIKKYPNHELAANAKYWLGETHYASQNFQKAAKKFLVGYQEHKTNPKAPDNLLKLALSLEQLKENQKACTILKKIQSEYPKATAILERAKQESAKLKCAG